MHRLNSVPATPDFSSIILLPIASRDHLGSDALRERRRWIGFLNDLFCGRSYIAAPAELSIFLFCLMKNPLLYRSAWPESSREASERFLMETLGRTQSERHRRSLSGMSWRCETQGGRKQLQLAI